MTPYRRAQILAHLPSIRDPEELEGFRDSLRESGELADSEVLGAVGKLSIFL